MTEMESMQPESLKTEQTPDPAETPAQAAAEEQPAETPAEETAEQPQLDTPDYVRMTLDAGVAPLEVRYAQINSCYRRLPVAYRSFTYVNSVIEGVLSPAKYAYAADETDRGMRLARYNIGQAVAAVAAFEQAGRHVEFVTARCPAAFTLQQDFYAALKELLDEFSCPWPEKICLEFPRTLLFEDVEPVRMALLSAKLLKVKTMMIGAGEKDAPLTPLLDLPLDYVTLAPWLSTLGDHRDKAASVASLVSFLRGLGIGVIADGVYNDAQITAFSRADCFGYMPSSGYTGDVAHGRLRMPLDEAVAQREEEEL